MAPVFGRLYLSLRAWWARVCMRMSMYVCVGGVPIALLLSYSTVLSVVLPCMRYACARSCCQLGPLVPTQRSGPRVGSRPIDFGFLGACRLVSAVARRVVSSRAGTLTRVTCTCLRSAVGFRPRARFLSRLRRRRTFNVRTGDGDPRPVCTRRARYSGFTRPEHALW